MNQKLLVRFIFLLFPFSLFSQVNTKKTDTLYFYNNNNKNNPIKSITVDKGKEKTITTYFRSGVIESVTIFKDSLYEKLEKFYESGIKSELYTYNKGVLTTVFLWHNNGELAKEENYKLIDKNLVLDGKYVTYFFNGKIKLSGNYKNNKKNGKWVEYYEDGNKISEINYQDEVKVGKALYYYKSGQLKTENQYILNENYSISKSEPAFYLEGEQKYYFENGKIESISHFEKGKLNGLYETWNVSGNKKSEINYCLDLCCGTYKTWYENGQLEKNVSFKNPIYDDERKALKDVLDGKYLTYYNNGSPNQIGYYKDGKLEGIQLKFHENNVKASEINFKDGLRFGSSKSYSKNGFLIVNEKYTIIKQNDELLSVKDGEYTSYSELNQQLLAQGHYKNGKKDGLWQNWYTNGKRASVISYKEDLYDGAITTWNENGSLRWESFHVIDTVNGVPTSNPLGADKQYDKNGKLYRIEYYNNVNECYHRKLFYADSTLKEEWYNLLPFDYLTIIRFGKHTTFYSNGNLESVKFHSNEFPLVRMIYYHFNGKPKKMEEFNATIDGRHKSGYEIYWRSDGELVHFKKYKDSKTFDNIVDTVLAKQFYENILQNSKAEGKIASGGKEGLYITWFQPGIKWMEETFKNDKHDGTFRVFYPNGKRMFEMELKNSIANGKLTVWDSAGNVNIEENYVNSKKDGVFTEYYSSGKKMSEKHYKVGAKRQLHEKKWRENGNLEYETNNNEAGQHHGESLNYHENGKLHYQTFYDNGKQNGKNTYYYSSGQIQMSNNYKNDLLEGEYISWYENGKISAKGNYKNNRREGYWEELSYDSIFSKGNYKLDEKDSIWTYYDSNGQLVSTETYKNGILQLKKEEPKKYEEFKNSIDFSNQLSPSEFRNMLISSNYQEGSTCQCVDSTKLKISYIPQITNLATLEEVRKKSFSFHEPIGDFYSDLYYMNYQFSTNQDVIWSKFDVVAFDEISLKIPEKNGLKLIFNPCIKVGGNATTMQVNMIVNRKDKNENNITVSTKNLAIDFNPMLLHQWDYNRDLPKIESTTKTKTKDSNIPSRLLLEATQINYNRTDRFFIKEYINPCFTLSEIGKTGILVNFDNMVLDLDNTQSPYEINQLFSSRKDDYSDNQNYKTTFQKIQSGSNPLLNDDFAGVFVPDATIYFPANIFTKTLKNRIFVEGKNILIAGEYLIGTIKLNVIAKEGQKYQLRNQGEEIIFDSDSIIKELKLRGVEKVQTKYDSTNAQFIIYFYISTNSH
jgi:uncharacterized protein